MKKAVLLLMTLILVFSCSQTGELRMNDLFLKDYPENRYMSSMGMGQTADAARENAYAGLARQFNSKVMVDQAVINRYDAFTDKSGFTETITEESVEEIRISADQEIINVKVTAVKKDLRGMYYVLAYVPRAATAKILSDRIERNREIIRGYVELAEKSHIEVKSYIYYNAAWLIAAKNDMMYKQIEVLDPLRLPGKAKNSFARLNTLREYYGSRIRFHVNIQHDEDQALWHTVSEAVTEAGFAVTREAGDMYVVGDVTLQPKAMHQENLSFMTWNLNLKMTDHRGDAVFAMTHTGTEGSLDAAGARQKAYRQMKAFTKKQFTDHLMKYFDEYLVTHKN